MKEKFTRLNQESEYAGQYKEHVKILASQSVATHYRVFLNKDIEDPHYYEDLIQVLLTASEEDVVEILANSCGGRLDSCIDIVNAIRASQAHTRCVITGEAHSAMSFIALACEDCAALPHSAMLIHQPRGGVHGRHSEQLAHRDFYEKHTEGFYKDVYKNFLTDQEIETVLKGNDIWLDHEQINEKIQKREELQRKEFHKQLRDTKKKIKMLKNSEAENP